MHSRLALLALLAGCGTLDPANLPDDDDSHAPSDEPVDEGDVYAEQPGDAFFEAETAFGVPEELLMAIARAETGIQMVEGHVEFPGVSAAFGVMALRGENLVAGAKYAGVSVGDARYDRRSNVLAAAALLDAWADADDIHRDDLGAWAPLVARYSGIDDPQALSEYVHREVYEGLAEGIEMEGLSVPPVLVDPDFPPPHAFRTGQNGTIWTASPNHSSRSGRSADFVIIHTCEGSYSGCWSWLINSNSGVSAHYVVNDSGTEVRQLVDEDRKAWHISANYDCGNNDGFECSRNGTSMNTVSIGIEHAGYGSQSNWASGLIERSAELTCGITKRHNIPRDSYHIVGHGQLQPWNRSDPGAAWPWNNYRNQIDAYCGGNPPSPSNPPNPPNPPSNPPSTGSQFVIDSNNGSNDTSRYYMEVSGDWWASANVSGYYNTGYWVAATGAISDPMKYHFYADSQTCWDVEAWWTSASDRPPAITFMGWDEDDNEVGRKTVDQTTGGARWNHLGTWQFPKGWNQVVLSRWAASGDYVIGDAIRLTETSCP